MLAKKVAKSNFFLARFVAFRYFATRNATRTMSEGQNKHDSTPKSLPPAGTTLQVDLSALLAADELEAFMRAADEAGRTPQEHFLAITLGEDRRAA